MLADRPVLFRCQLSIQLLTVMRKHLIIDQLRFSLFSLVSFSLLFIGHYTGPGRVAQSVGHLTRKSGVLGSIPGLATYFRFSFRFFKKGSCQLLAKVCERSTG